MTEQHPEQPTPQSGTEAGIESTGAVADDAPMQTGHPVVDGVLASLSGLDETPVSEHVAVFENAHDRLRSALAEAGNTPA